MPTKEELEQITTVLLAVECGKIAEDQRADETVAEKACELKQEWAGLMGRQTPPPDYKTMRALEVEELRRRMIQFLSEY